MFPKTCRQTAQDVMNLPPTCKMNKSPTAVIFRFCNDAPFALQIHPSLCSTRSKPPLLGYALCYCGMHVNVNCRFLSLSLPRQNKSQWFTTIVMIPCGCYNCTEHLKENVFISDDMRKPKLSSLLLVAIEVSVLGLIPYLVQLLTRTDSDH